MLPYYSGLSKVIHFKSDGKPYRRYKNGDLGLDPAGWVRERSGYRYINFSVDGKMKSVPVRRLFWWMHINREIPKCIKFRNGDRDYCTINNLLGDDDVFRLEHHGLRKGANGTWNAQSKYTGKLVYLGAFDGMLDAAYAIDDYMVLNGCNDLRELYEPDRYDVMLVRRVDEVIPISTDIPWSGQ